MATDHFQGASGQSYVRGAPLGEGPRAGEGATGRAWQAHRRGSGEPLVLKLFNPRFCTPAMRRRVAWLVERRLDRASPVLRAPIDVVDGPLGFGHVSPFAAGVPFETYLGEPTAGFLDHLVCAAAIAAGVMAMERQGLAHGDLHAQNVRVDKRDGALRAALIDFDNCVAPGLPPPPSIGQARYYAPEIRRDPRPARVTAETDRYALAVLLHELLLARHPVAAVVDTDPIRCDQVMRVGGWPDDPAGSPHPRGDEGLPVDCLDTRLQSLFRRALGPAPEARPHGGEWFAALGNAADNVYQCDHCRRPFIVDGGKRQCPYCRRRFIDYRLCIPSRPPIVLRDKVVPLTARQLRDGGADVCQALLRRHGPDALLEPTGRVAIARLGERGAVPLEPRRPHLLRPGDRLRLGDVEAQVAIGPHAAAAE
ncbi:MAG: hypothetical protein JOY64_04480 [Alphaproteobacteria bacterium]|nr:hypothetical protein [Alphaproteobacteria bacterium]MBV8406864.1 hypothetical protein [Alphaproteobacteria bacterium]